MTETFQKKSKFSVAINKVLEALKSIFAPNLVALSAAGILKGIVILLHTFGIIQEGKAEYEILSTISDAVFYYLPILLAYSAADVFKTNRALAATTAFFLLHPHIISVFENNYVVADFFGLPIPAGYYPSSVIPIILIIWAQSYLEKLWNRIIPDIVQGIFSPMLTLVTTCILGITIIGPFGNFIGDILAQLISFFNSHIGFLVPTLMGAFGLFVVMAGAHYSLFPVVTQALADPNIGYDNILTPGLLASNLALAGAVFAIYFKTRNNAYKQYTVSAGVTSMLGVSQPGLYGVAIMFKQVMRGAVIGGGIGGLYAGIVGFKSYAFTNPGITSIPAFIAPDGTWMNLIHGIIVMVVSFAIGFIIAYAGKFAELSEEQVSSIVASN